MCRDIVYIDGRRLLIVVNINVKTMRNAIRYTRNIESIEKISERKERKSLLMWLRNCIEIKKKE